VEASVQEHRLAVMVAFVCIHHLLTQWVLELQQAFFQVVIIITLVAAVLEVSVVAE